MQTHTSHVKATTSSPWLMTMTYRACCSHGSDCYKRQGQRWSLDDWLYIDIMIARTKEEKGRKWREFLLKSLGLGDPLESQQLLSTGMQTSDRSARPLCVTLFCCFNERKKTASWKFFSLTNVANWIIKYSKYLQNSSFEMILCFCFLFTVDFAYSSCWILTLFFNFHFFIFMLIFAGYLDDNFCWISSPRKVDAK